MTRLRHSVVIDRPLNDTYKLARQVESYPKFLPGYLESRIVDRQGNRVLLQRKAMLGQEVKEWKSWASFTENEAILFEHAEGPLMGMQVTWDFKSLSPQKTKLSITHVFALRQYKPSIDRIAGLVVEAFKTACEHPRMIV